VKRLTYTQRTIIRLYTELLASGVSERLNLGRTIAVKMGYTLDKNNSNSYVLSVLREYESNRIAEAA
jgi:hypothetical protein